MKTLNEIVSYLDQRFDLKAYEADKPFSVLVPQVYAHDGRRADALFDKTFFPTCNGLMLTGKPTIKKVYLAVFLNDEVIAKIAQEDTQNALIFTHHPIPMETSHRGFLPLSPEAVETLHQKELSVYSLHTPLDQNLYLSTTLTLAQGIQLQALKPFTPNGLIGHLPQAMPIETFLDLVCQDLAIESINSIVRHRFVQTVAIIPGGGCRGHYFYQAVAERADVFYTGTYNDVVQTPHGEKHRRELAEFIAEDPLLTLIEGSHYATEAPVLKKDMSLLFERELGLKTQFIPQLDPWY